MGRKEDFKIVKIDEGSCSSAFYIKSLFMKFVVNRKKYDIYKREKYLASILNRFDWFPTLLFSYDDEELLIFKKCGVPVTKENCPKDFVSQMNKILDDLESVNIQHNDIKNEEILVDSNGKVYLCDFGWGSINNNFDCGIDIWGGDNKSKPGGWLSDKSFRLEINNIES